MEKKYTLYVLVFPNGQLYFGVTDRPTKVRWNNGKGYNGKMKKYIKFWGWENIEKNILKEGLTHDEAYYYEGILIDEGKKRLIAINNNRSGLISKDMSKYYNNYYYGKKNEELKEKNRDYKRKRKNTPGWLIYNRVSAFNNYNPERMIETAYEAKMKFLNSGYIPMYVKHDDLTWIS